MGEKTKGSQKERKMSPGLRATKRKRRRGASLLPPSRKREKRGGVTDEKGKGKRSDETYYRLLERSKGADEHSFYQRGEKRGKSE